MIRGIIIAFLAIGVIGTGYWGYKEHQEKNAVLIHAENNYQRAFHDLSYQMDQLHDKIGTTLAMNSRESLSPALAEVWRITSEAHNDVGQLPLTLLPFNKTEEFLASIGDFSYRAAIRDLENKPLSKDEYASLQALYGKSTDIQNELRNVQHMVLDKNLRWMDVELALASGKKQQDNTIVDGFKSVENNVSAYSETDFGPGFTSMKTKEKGFEQLKGKDITAEQAKQRAKEFASTETNQAKVTQSGKGAGYEFYSVSMYDKKHKADLYMDITKKGGYPIWLIQSRDVKEANISLNDASNNAVSFLKKHGFETEDLVLNESAQYDNIGVFSYVPNENGILLYPDTLRIKVALDDGQIIGFSAKDFLAAHRKRDIPKPSLKEDQARQKINQKVMIQESRLAVITNELGEEVLCYEFLGTIDEDTYRMFINADSGMEEKVEKLKNAEPIFNEL
ncbi:germination protein YpeB [Bacillus sp. FJAT-42376]|uniref:germination protein YpeB n=1 Tax=Bacillus sp. FJAT-42376 TaxID=2014076 RepID=UPI000F4EE118|nr:germination protein YpeB [Bacillus sp. FJAT-42376]AZB43359.1 germination protein YpeB [Bacillus sp. FJAT-42376]